MRIQADGERQMHRQTDLLPGWLTHVPAYTHSSNAHTLTCITCRHAHAPHAYTHVHTYTYKGHHYLQVPTHTPLHTGIA